MQNKSKKSDVKVLEYFTLLIEKLRQERKIGTANNYLNTQNSFRAFLCDSDVPFKRITPEFIGKYERWLIDRGVVRNSSSFYLRILRAVYNKAVRDNIVKQRHPFDNVYTGVDHTRKRAIDEDIILRMIQMKLTSSPLRLARDLFVFSYCMRGMAFVDIAFARKSSIVGNTLSYIRRKTGRQMNVKIEPCAQNIIDFYSETTADNQYIFPIITSEKPEEAYKEYQLKMDSCNRKLKQLASELNENIDLSFYTARHTWATIARNKNVPISVISAGMGHTSVRTTEIYLTSLDNSVIDKANKYILEPLNDYSQL